jgi:hypothetical protein
MIFSLTTFPQTMFPLMTFSPNNIPLTISITNLT